MKFVVFDYCKHQSSCSCLINALKCKQHLISFVHFFFLKITNFVTIKMVNCDWYIIV